MGKLQGNFSVMPIADLVQWARSAQKSGRLTLVGPQAQQIEVTFLGGRIVFSATDSGRETFGSYLVHLRLCSAEDVAWARAREKESGARLGSLLVTSGRLSREVAIQTLAQKTVEDLCSVFLWRDGAFEFRPEPGIDQEMLSIDLDPIRIVDEGLRRAETWGRLRAALDLSIVFDRHADRPFRMGADWENPMVAANVVALVDGERNVADILDRLPFSDYQVRRALAQLRDEGLIHRGDQTGIGLREKRIGALALQAEEAQREHRWSDAVHILEGLAEAYPRRAELSQKLLGALEGFRQAVYRQNFTTQDVPVVTIGPDALHHLDLDARSGFLVSRIDGRSTVGEILKIASLPEVQALRLLKRLLDARVIDFPNRML